MIYKDYVNLYVSGKDAMENMKVIMCLIPTFIAGSNYYFQLFCVFKGHLKDCR